MTARPHDALFKSAFEAPASAGALLGELLPPALCAAIAWDTLTGEPGSFVDPSLADHHVDLLFSARTRTGDPVLVHLLLEHQSTSDPVMPLRTLTYETRIWRRFHKDRPDDRLPPIIAVVISHVPGGWTAARSFEELFEPSVVAIPGLLLWFRGSRWSLPISPTCRMTTSGRDRWRHFRNWRYGCCEMRAIRYACWRALAPGRRR